MFAIEKPIDVAKFVTAITAIAIVTTVGTNYFLLEPDVYQETRLVSLLVAIMIAIPVAVLVGFKLLEIYRLNEKLNFLLGHDHLTRVMTRDRFLAYFNETDTISGTALMLDIDHFKLVNDTYGHFIGDEVIKHVSSILANACRNMDKVCRFGGEEFIIFLHGADPQEGSNIAERIRQSIESTPVYVESHEIFVTISIGVAHKTSVSPIDQVLQIADTMLYKAKDAGRNQVFGV